MNFFSHTRTHECTEQKSSLIQVFSGVARKELFYARPGKSLEIIMKTYLYNFDPRKPHLYIVKLGFTGVYIIFLFLLNNIDCGYLLEPPQRGGSNEYPQPMFWAEIWKILEFFI